MNGVRFVDAIESRLLALVQIHAELLLYDPTAASTLEGLERQCLDEVRAARSARAGRPIPLRLIVSNPALS